MATACETEEKLFFKVKDLARRWGMSEATVHREVERGKLTKLRMGGCLRFAKSEVERYEREAVEG